MTSCIFCSIAQKKASSNIIYEDDQCIAFLDQSPASPGHILIIPKEHHTTIYTCPEPTWNHITSITQKLAKHITTQLKAEGCNIIQSNGSAAQQEVEHLHIHIIPRNKNDGIDFHHIPLLLTEQEKQKIVTSLKIDEL